MHDRLKKWFKDDYANAHILCVECCPTEYNDGSIKREAGKWHDRFSKKHWNAVSSRGLGF